MPLTDYQQRLIISLWTQSKESVTTTSIERTLATEGIHTTLQTVKSTIKRWKITGDVRDCPEVYVQ